MLLILNNVLATFNVCFLTEAKLECEGNYRLLFREYCYSMFGVYDCQTMEAIDDSCWKTHRGNLASIHSQEENEAVRKYSSGENFHIGLLKDDGYWKWVDDMQVDWTNWENPDSNNNNDNYDRNDGGDNSKLMTMTMKDCTLLLWMEKLGNGGGRK